MNSSEQVINCVKELVCCDYDSKLENQSSYNDSDVTSSMFKINAENGEEHVNPIATADIESNSCCVDRTDILRNDSLNSNVKESSLERSNSNSNQKEIDDNIPKQYDSGDTGSISESYSNEANIIPNEHEHDHQFFSKKNNKKKKICRCLLRLLLFILMSSFVTFLIIDSMNTGRVKNIMLDFLDWLEANPVTGIFVFAFGKYFNFVVVGCLSCVDRIFYLVRSSRNES